MYKNRSFSDFWFWMPYKILNPSQFQLSKSKFKYSEYKSSGVPQFQISHQILNLSSLGPQKPNFKISGSNWGGIENVKYSISEILFWWFVRLSELVSFTYFKSRIRVLGSDSDLKELMKYSKSVAETVLLLKIYSMRSHLQLENWWNAPAPRPRFWREMLLERN